jgi:hypothetical protein
MRHLSKIGILGGGVVALIVIAGFFHAESKSPEACTVLAPPPSLRVAKAGLGDHESEKRGDYGEIDALVRPQGFLALTNAPGYKRAGDLSLRVADCTKAEDDLETKLQEIHGEIVEMLMEGTEGSRTCSLSVVIPSDKFRGFITELRKMGKIQTERITASKLKPGQGAVAGKEAEVDPRELSLVNIRMADEKVAQNVLESRGVLAASFDRGTSHFLKGLAVLVEFLGLVLPFALAFLGVAAPFVIGMRIRRAKTAVAVQ